MKENKTELSLHGGFGTHTDPIKLQAEKDELERLIGEPIYGNRHHFLKFEFPITWEIEHQINLLYDTTIGFNDKVGFKNGIAFPFFAIDRNLSLLPLIELPLTVMDAAIWTGLQLTEETAVQIIQQVRDIIKQYHGLLTLLWHHSVLKMRGGRIYPKILQKLVENSAFIAPGLEIANWWRARNEVQVELIPHDDDVTIKLQNPQNIKNLGIMITAEQMELVSHSSNLQLLEKSVKGFKFTFLSGNSGEIKLNKN